MDRGSGYHEQMSGSTDPADKWVEAHLPPE
jgi:hypothetical protein